MRAQWSWTRLDRTAALTALGAAAAVLAFGVLAYSRRWISDDGLIVVRTVDNILAGNGPVFNAFERAESNTSTLWTWIVALATFVSRQPTHLVAVVMGWLLSVGGFALAIDATRRWQRQRGSRAILVPATAWILVAVSPFWDFATSGLETGLCMFWVAACWWLLVTLTSTRGSQLRAVIVFGLGPLVRPDFALVSIGFCAGAWLLVRPPLRRTLALLGAGLALPIAYEIFRAGYYGTLVPLPALAKSASDAKWDQGMTYLTNFARPYWLWLVLVALVPVLAIAIRRGALASRDRVLAATAAGSSLLLTLFIVRVGGDFMHGRMMLVPMLLLVLPAMVLPLHRVTLPALALILVWAALVTRRSLHHPNVWDPMIWDERQGYVLWTRSKHPLDPALFVAADGIAPTLAAKASAERRRVVVAESGFEIPLHPAVQVPIVFFAGRLGTGSAIAQLDGIAIDAHGLAHPIGARIVPNQRGHVGHERMLPFTWIRAEYTEPALDDKPLDGSSKISIQAARNALRCGELAELLQSVREPLTLSRFWDNLVGSVRRTRLVIPSDPIEAEWRFCGTLSVTARASASSSYEGDGWSVSNVVDRQRESAGSSNGYSSQPGEPQWLELRFGTAKRVSKVTIYPRAQPAVGIGFPVDFSIQIWDGTRWIDRVTKSGYPRPSGPETFAMPAGDVTDRIRIHATKLSDDGDGPRMQLAEVEVE
jgi:arabinofuranosyltransferase